MASHPLLDKLGGDVDEALAAYHADPSPESLARYRQASADLAAARLRARRGGDISTPPPDHGDATVSPAPVAGAAASVQPGS